MQTETKSLNSDLLKPSTVPDPLKSLFVQTSMVSYEGMFLNKEFLNFQTTHKDIRLLIKDFFSKMKRIFYGEFISWF